MCGSHAEACIFERFILRLGGQHHDSHSEIVRQTGGQFRTVVKLILRRRHRPLIRFGAFQKVVQVRLVGERAQRKRLVLVNVNLERILRT